MATEFVRLLRRMLPDCEVTELHSPRSGGPDLTGVTAAELERRVPLHDPGSTAVIHAAARVESDTRDAAIDNLAMAVPVAEWARNVGVGFATLVSSVSVYGDLEYADETTPAHPSNLYGVGKRAAEVTWEAVLGEDRRCVVRLAGVWGWQRRPTLFWSDLLHVAARGVRQDKPVVMNPEARRNYISVYEAAACLLHVTAQRVAGCHLAAGAEDVDVATFVEALAALPGSRLEVDARPGRPEARHYRPSTVFRPVLVPFSDALEAVWRQRPDWAGEPD